MKPNDFSGKTFGRWSVLRRVENNASGQAMWLCRCECGTERVLKAIIVNRSLQGLKDSVSYSCGCLRNELFILRSTKHGHATGGVISPTYHSWSGMISRCRDPNHDSFMRYGGRGIAVCDHWLTFANFLADMGEKPEGSSLDRIDLHGNYEPANCRWASAKQQARNKRSNRFITFNGERLILADWAARLGINQETLRERLAKWPIEKALTVGKLW